MPGKDSGWDALFESDDEIDSILQQDPRSGAQSPTGLARFRNLPGVRGAVQVTLDGVVLHHDAPGEIEYYAALAASIGSTARQIDSMLTLNGYDYAVVRLTSDIHPTLIFREQDSFIALLLSGEIAPSHIVTRLRDLRSGGIA